MPAIPQQRMPSGHTRSVPPPIPRGQQQPGGGSNGFGVAQQVGNLSVIYQGERLPVTKDRFVIGRGKQSSDLTLKDPNVSRQHAMVEFQNGVYFMVDMGSTNGVEYNGQRIARKQIAEGDVFKICDHEMRFTYR
jgi:neural Wiskott-Aldrich syndrome protein